MHDDWLMPSWPAPTSVRAICTTRTGGQSMGPYGSMNLGDHVKDRPCDVAANRLALSQALGVRVSYLTQVHGANVVELKADTPDGYEADASMTTVSGLACCIMVADCLPILLTDREGTFVAAAHAGWRGLAGAVVSGGAGVLASLLNRIKEKSTREKGFEASELMAWLGPCIGPTAFEVGHEVLMAFARGPAPVEPYFKAAGPSKWHADLAGLAREQLRGLGVDSVYGNDSSSSWCTVNNPSRFFSYRRDGLTGRMAALVWRV